MISVLKETQSSANSRNLVRRESRSKSRNRCPSGELTTQASPDVPESFAKVVPVLNQMALVNNTEHSIDLEERKSTDFAPFWTSQVLRIDKEYLPVLAVLNELREVDLLALILRKSLRCVGKYTYTEEGQLFDLNE
jgi:hypothetical protein